MVSAANGTGCAHQEGGGVLGWISVAMSMAADSRENARGGVLELLEGRVLLEALGEILGALRVQSVVAEAVSTGRIGVSAAADSRESEDVRRT